MEVSAKDSTPTVRLVDTADLYSDDIEPYAALSYCWGTRSNLKTTKNNVQSFRKSIEWEDLPPTLQDAIRVCRELAIRYIWIDALAIIQDDSSDLAKTLSQMPAIYAGACITIIASRATGVHEGFLGPRIASPHPEDVFKLPYKCHDGSLGSIVLYEMYGGEDTLSSQEPAEKRCWTLQERVLSPQTLDYGTMQLSWACKTSDAQLDLVDGFEPPTSKHSWMSVDNLQSGDWRRG